ncbi:hypothetical protein NI17_013885 [Thermobifida halotolerans]|uniref:Uncharacterized protein n=1 Tax=Thermobifida halotolerans TaxID=483545 RepID=A0A399G7E9_9ACTN|nr:MFS transporter [Thermobifida halotolerans]UOE17951.1 hypothetical protein NI17_013885 [Thermobifida halotolerans]
MAPGDGAVARSRPFPAGSAVAPVMLMVLILFTVDAVVQTVLPVALAANGLGSGLLVGVFLALAQGLGLLIAPPVNAHADRRGRRGVLAVGGLLIAACAVGVVLAVGRGAWVWVVVVLGYGLGRGATVVTTLAVVARTGDPYRTQGYNGATQRLAAALAAVLAATVLTDGRWVWAFWLTAAFGIAFALLSLRVAGPGGDPGAGVAVARSYPVSLGMLRGDRALQASSLVNLNLACLTLIGNSFYPFVLDVPAGELAGWLLALLLCRDLAAVASGPLFGTVVGRVGMRGVLLLTGGCSVAGLLAVGLGGGIAGVVVGALLQGVAISTGIGATNILATSAREGGTGLRLAATNYLNGVGSVAVPVLLGLSFDLAGASSVFVLGALVCAALVAGVLALGGGTQAGSNRQGRGSTSVAP